jgi:hypothetical protein
MMIVAEVTLKLVAMTVAKVVAKIVTKLIVVVTDFVNLIFQLR